ncbi:MAG: EAL domain-containing protein [Alphaproteobacteria bacterium]|nr:EAL domain-containing protein [Alphaproteobacteria bacterium]
MINRIRLQPLVSLCDQIVFGYEALYNKGQQKFFPSALDVIQCVFKHGKTRSNFQLYANLTSQDVVSHEFARALIDTIHGLNISPHNIVLEISEETNPDVMQKSIDVLQFLRKAGVKIALDDFGVQYSSLAYFHDLPVDIVKIDQRFVQSAPVNNKAKSILKFAANLSHEFGCKVVAEGIETETQLQCALEAKIDIGQGFLFSPVRKTKVTSPFANLCEFIAGAIRTPSAVSYCI